MGNAGHEFGKRCGGGGGAQTVLRALGTVMHMQFSLKVKEAFQRARQYNSGVIIHFLTKLAIPIMCGKWEKLIYVS